MRVLTVYTILTNCKSVVADAEMNTPAIRYLQRIEQIATQSITFAIRMSFGANFS